MTRYQLKESQIVAKEISNSTLFDLSGILYVEDKRTYFVSLTAPVDFALYINSIKCDSIDCFINAEMIGETVNTAVNANTDPHVASGPWLRFTKSKSDLDIRCSIREVVYKYVVDTKTSKKSGTGGESKDDTKQKEDKSKWINHQVDMSKKIWNEVRDA